MKSYIALFITLLIATDLLAQHQHKMVTDTAKVMQMGHQHKTSSMDNMKVDTAMPMMMTSQYSLSLPMNRDGSGTSWVPDETPMYGYMIHGKKWMSMIHGSVFARYNNQDLFKSGNRGSHKLDAPNWIMAMTQRRIGNNGLFSINTMFSLDPLLVGNGGYPLLYQTGESYKGKKLVDRQHPHDLFSELSIAYTQRLNKNADIYLSIGYPGEPAFGPPVFMHRLSAMNDPNAPLGHHYQDATHITFGDATVGFRYKKIKLEGSVFTGREPDESRYDFDKARFDSYSLRLSYNPTKEWALQVSNGWLHSPEEAEPQHDPDRSTISAIHTKMLNDNSYIATTLVYGQNNDHHKTQSSVLLESTLQLNKIAVYGRYEFVQKNAEELDLVNIYPNDPDFNINAITLGTNRILAGFKNTSITGGVQATLNISPGALRSLYGTAPIGFQFYIRINPALMKMGDEDDMEM